MQRRKFWTLLIATICLAIAALVAGGWLYLDQEHRSLPFPLSAEPVVAHRIYFMPDGSPPPANAPRIHDWQVIGDPVPVPPDIAAEIRDILATRSTYTLHDSQCFEPGLALSFGDGPNRVDVLICLLCNRAVFYRGDTQVGHCISDEGNQRLTSIYKRLFKTDPPAL